MQKKIKRAAAALFVIAAFVVVSTMDHEDQQAQHAHCLEMVDDGVWPKEACDP